MRGLSKNFLDAMRKGLNKGRSKGRVGWDRHWENTWFPYSPIQCLIDGLHREIDELIIALYEGDPGKILTEASDTANFCMFLADVAKEKAK